MIVSLVTFDSSTPALLQIVWSPNGVKILTFNVTTSSGSIYECRDSVGSLME